MLKQSVIVGIGILACAVLSGTASAAVVTWDMGVALDGAQTWAMTKVGDGYGDVAAGDFPPTGNAGINSSELGPYSRLVDSGSYGNDGFVMQNSVSTPISATYTIDLIVRGERKVNSTGRSAGIRVGTATGTASAGIGIEPGSAWGDVPEVTGGNSLWITIRNGAYVPYGFLFTRTNEYEGEAWRAIRLVSPGDNTLLVYDFVDGSGTGTLAGTAGPGSWPGGGAGAELSALGFHLNSLSGGTVMSSGFSLLGLALNTDTALDGSAPYMLGVVPEPASVLLLTMFGGLALIRRRR